MSRTKYNIVHTIVDFLELILRLHDSQTYLFEYANTLIDLSVLEDTVYAGHRPDH